VIFVSFLNEFLRKELSDDMSIVHGGNVYETASKLGCAPEEILDYSASINPLGPPPGLVELLGDTFQRLQHYPDIQNRALIESIARHHGVLADQVVVGNGSTELIYWLPQVLGIRKALILLPAFGEYQKAFELQGVRLAKLFASPGENFQPTVEQLDELADQFLPEAILFTHPGSPAGTLLPPAVREWLIAKGRSQKVFCIVDEVFIDFCEEQSLKAFLRDLDHLVIIRSMTKFYGLPGLRLGYVLASEPVAARLRHCLPPWSVNTYAQVAGPYCFEQREYRDKTLTLIAGERSNMIARLETLEECRVFPGEANYLLMQLGQTLPPAARLQQDLLASDRILVRDCRSFEGLDIDYVRFAVRLPDQNQRLLEALSRWVKGQSH
jgi:threonine-phosphate decarboxylase